MPWPWRRRRSTCWWAGPAPRWPWRRWRCSAVPTAAGWWRSVGRGNNGADGRVAAQVLARRGARVRIVEAGAEAAIGPADLVIDAAFGTGFRGEYRSPAVDAGTPVLAVDIPSGVHGDTGQASGVPVAATRTVTFVALKPGLVQGDGRSPGRSGVGRRHRPPPGGLPGLGHGGPRCGTCSLPVDVTATSGRPRCWWWRGRRG